MSFAKVYPDSRLGPYEIFSDQKYGSPSSSYIVYSLKQRVWCWSVFLAGAQSASFAMKSAPVSLASAPKKPRKRECLVGMSPDQKLQRR